MAIQSHADGQTQVAVGSLSLDRQNNIKILKVNENAASGIGTHSAPSLELDFEFEHEYPPTKLMWSPPSVPLSILASSSELVQLWHIKDNRQQDLIWDASDLRVQEH